MMMMIIMTMTMTYFCLFPTLAIRQVHRFHLKRIHLKTSLSGSILEHFSVERENAVITVVMFS